MANGYDAFSTRVLAVLVGASPAVYSETLFELSRSEGLGFLPTRIVLVTTAVGAAAVQEQLLDPVVQVQGRRVSRQDRLFGLLGLVGDRAPAFELLVPMAEDGTEVEDAHSEAELGAIGDELLTLVNGITANENSALVLSLSGGRKGMSHLAGQVMSACARAQDRLVHVAVEPPWLEMCPDFFHPDPDERSFETTDADGNRLEVAADQVRLDLSFQPFWRMRKFVQPELSNLASSGFRDLVARFDADSGGRAEVELVVDLTRGDARLGQLNLIQRSGAMGLQPPELAYLALLAERQANGSGIPIPMGDALARRLIEFHDGVKAARTPHRTPDAAVQDLVWIIEQLFTRKDPNPPVSAAGACNGSPDGLLGRYLHIGDNPDPSSLADRYLAVASDRSDWQRARCARLNWALEHAAPTTLSNDQVRIPTGMRHAPAVVHRLPAAVRARVVLAGGATSVGSGG
jgi:CRISPR-associated protein (TIGR02584 family)